MLHVDSSQRGNSVARQLTTSDIRQPGISASQRLVTAVLKASIACAGGAVRPGAMVSEGNKVDSVDIGGDAIFTRQAELVRSAKKDVCIQTVAWDANAPGAKMIPATVR